MFWMGIGVTLLIGVVVITVRHTNRPSHDLGAVSGQWIAEHHADSL
jgi:hypothetical protein